MENLNFYIELVREYGYLVIGLVILGEATGIPLPGEIILVMAGVAASLGYLNLSTVILVATLAAFLGYNVGYFLGRKYGLKVLRKIEHMRAFRPEKISKIERFFKIHGNKTIFLGRLLPVFRTYVAIFAGFFKVPYTTFSFYNLLGATGWSLIFALLGFLVGNNLPLLQLIIQDFKNILMMLAAIITIIIAYNLFKKEKTPGELECEWLD